MKNTTPTYKVSLPGRRAESPIRATKYVRSILTTGAFLLCLAASVLQAQVTYRPNYNASDFSTLASNGTATIRYDLVGSPAESPYGSSFTVSLTLGPLETTGSPLTYAATAFNGFSPQNNNDVYLGISVRPNLSNLQASDLIHLSSTATAREDALAGLYDPNYTLTYTTSTLPASTGWLLTSGGIWGSSGFSAGGGGGVNSYQQMQFTIADHSLAPFGAGGPESIGDAVSVGYYYVYSGTGTNGALINIQGNSISHQIGFQSLTFAPVPEPGGAFMVAVAGILLIFKRRRR